MSLKTPAEWAAEEGMSIAEPWGWTNDGLDVSAPCSYEEYHARMLASRVVPYSEEFGVLEIAGNAPTQSSVAPVAPAVPTEVWAAYYKDLSSLALFDNELNALRYAVGKQMQVRVVEFGVDLTEAL